MWLLRKKQNLEFDALSATPSGVDLSGHWRAYELTPNGEVLSGVRLTQYGAAVFGQMQCKFAAAPPLVIRGIVLGERFIANYWRPHKQLMGSGLLELTVGDDVTRLFGTGTWHSAANGEQEVYECRWVKNST